MSFRLFADKRCARTYNKYIIRVYIWGSRSSSPSPSPPHAYVHYACFIITKTMSRTTLNHFWARGCSARSLIQTSTRAYIYAQAYMGDELVYKSDCVYIDGRCWWGPIIQHRISPRRHISSPRAKKKIIIIIIKNYKYYRYTRLAYNIYKR